jgi:hypothetical protein
MSQETLAAARVWSLCPKPDRRSQRISVTACETCGATRVAIVSRTDYVLYLRCPDCCQVWSLPKPGREPGAGASLRSRAVTPVKVDRAIIERGEPCRSF